MAVKFRENLRGTIELKRLVKECLTQWRFPIQNRYVSRKYEQKIPRLPSVVIKTMFQL